MVLGIRNCPVPYLHILNRCGATGDGWVVSVQRRCEGRYGKAGLLLRAPRRTRLPRSAAAAPRAVKRGGTWGRAGRCSETPRDAGTEPPVRNPNRAEAGLS